SRLEGSGHAGGARSRTVRPACPRAASVRATRTHRQARPWTARPAMFHPQGPTFWELARQALSSTERGYDLLAPKFDVTPFRTPDCVLDRVGEQLAPLGPFDAGLDVCCGTGAALRMLRPLCRGRGVGLDFSAGRLGG